MENTITFLERLIAGINKSKSLFQGFKILFICGFLLPPLTVFSQQSKTPVFSSKGAPSVNAKGANLLRGPYLQVATGTSIMIRWRTDGLTRSRVRYGPSPDELFNIKDDSLLTTEHKVVLTGLTPRTRYYYSFGGVTDTLQWGKDNYFQTLPVTGEEELYRIGVFGDCGNNSDNQRAVRDAFVKYLGDDYMDAWILLGDNAYRNGYDVQYQLNFFDIYKDNLLKKYPLFPAPGNHEYRDEELSDKLVQKNQEIPYFKIFSMPEQGEAGGLPSGNPAYYSVDIGNIHFISLDSYGVDGDFNKMYDTLGVQAQWVKKDLEANKNKGWVIAFWHHPPYTMGSHDSDKESNLVRTRENFVRIIERYGVDLVLCGHSHVYERSRLMKGHFGMEESFDSLQHNLSQSTALYDGSTDSCPYIKSTDDGRGTVYVVSGSAGQLSTPKPTFPHKAMYYSDPSVGGAPILEVQGNRLDLKWICADGKIRDQFTMMKQVNKRVEIKAKRGEPVTLTASYNGNYRWSNGNSKTRTIQVTPPAGKTTYTVKDDNNCLQDVFEVTVSGSGSNERTRR